MRLATLHVDTATATVLRATVAGRRCRWSRATGRWGFGLVFHAPPPEGVEVTLTLRADRPDRWRCGRWTPATGWTALPGFRPRPPAVGVVGSHTSEMLAVARTYQI